MLRLCCNTLILLLLPLLAACSSSRPPAPGGPDRVVLMLNWYPEAEHGGFYAAQVHGIFEQYGLEVEIRPGGPSAPVAQELVTGRVQFAIGNADDVLLFRNAEVPVVSLMAPIQNTPRCVLVREDSGVTELSGLSGMVLQANVGRPFLNFMTSRGFLNGVQVVPYSGNVAKLVSDKNTAIQAYSFSEPFMAQQQGVATRPLMLSEIGFNPYASCLLSTEAYIADNRDVVRRMVVACRDGWKKYLESPQQTNAVILANNQHGMTAEALEFGVAELRPLCQPDSLSSDEIGRMTLQRWNELVEQFSEIDLIDTQRVKAEDVFTSDFINRSSPVD